MIFAGRNILCVIKLSSINGDDVLLSTITNMANDLMDNKANDKTIICVAYALTLLLLLFPMYVRISKNEVYRNSQSYGTLYIKAMPLSTGLGISISLCKMAFFF